MSDINWYNTKGGREFADYTVPALVESINKLCKINEKLIETIEILSDRVDILEEHLAANENKERSVKSKDLPEDVIR